MDLPELHPVIYQNVVFRNIFTCAPSQDLLDDVCDRDEAAIVDGMIQITSGIDHGEPQRNRVYQYGTLESDDVLAVFRREKWGLGRFGDGLDYGVWYSAEDEMTSVYEACWTTYRLAQDNVLPRREVYTTDRKMFRARVRSQKAVDLMPEKELHPRLTSEDYGFCQILGKRFRESAIEMARTPSARRRTGVCTPIFSPEPIRDISFLYYLSFHVHPNGNIHVNSAHAEGNFSGNLSIDARQLVLS